MRAKRRTEQEQYEIIMECRQSGLSDHQWCLEHDINPGIFITGDHSRPVNRSLWTDFYRRYCRDHKTRCNNGTSDRTGCSADQ